MCGTTLCWFINCIQLPYVQEEHNYTHLVMKLNYNLFIYIQQDIAIMYKVTYTWVISHFHGHPCSKKKNDSCLKKKVVDKKNLSIWKIISWVYFLIFLKTIILIVLLLKKMGVSMLGESSWIFVLYD